MISLWITIGLVISATSIASLGAYFSIVGIGALFSGALLAVSIMAASLEFAKFTLAAYLHHLWYRLNKLYRAYLVFSVVVLSVITSMGIFGFLSDAYQDAAVVFDTENIKLENLKSQQRLYTSEIARLNKSVDEIPETRLTKKLALRAQFEPTIKNLYKKVEEGEKEIAAANLRLMDSKKKVGPLIYIAKMLNKDTDTIVKYLIFVFVSVFDPLAICLVIASTHAIESRRHGKYLTPEDKADANTSMQFSQNLQTVQDVQKPTNESFRESTFAQQAGRNSEDITEEVTNASEKILEPEEPEDIAEEVTNASEKILESEEPEDIIVQMNFKDETEDKKAV